MQLGTILSIAEKPPARRKPATIKTIAKDLGLSISTVSRALQQDAAVKAETRLLINEAADRLGYRRDFRGVNLRTGRTFTLCALLTSNPSSAEFGDPAMMNLIQGLISGVAGTPFKVVIRPVESVEEQMAACRDAVVDGRFDGFLFDHTEPQDARVLYLLEHGVPFITFGRTELFSEHPDFDIDNEDAAYQATRHLIDKGHKRIALIDPPQHYLFSGQRHRGYRRAIDEAGLTYDPKLVAEMGIGIRSVRDRVAKLLKLDERPTGFVTSNEIATIGTLGACRTLPRKEFAACGFVSRDGTTLFDYLEPPVSSLYFSLLEAGKRLSAALVEAVEGRPAREVQWVERAKLIAR